MEPTCQMPSVLNKQKDASPVHSTRLSAPRPNYTEHVLVVDSKTSTESSIYIYIPTTPSEWKLCNSDCYVCREHLYRCHCKPKHLCVRCGKTFQKQSEQDAHLREEIPCSKKDIDLDFDISSEVQESIRTRDSRKKNITGSEKVDLDEEKWKTIFKLIFPQVETDDIPLPCKLIRYFLLHYI